MRSKEKISNHEGPPGITKEFIVEGFLRVTSCPSWFRFCFRLKLSHTLIFGFVDFPFPLCENPPKRPLCGGNGAQYSELKQRFPLADS